MRGQNFSLISVITFFSLDFQANLIRFEICHHPSHYRTFFGLTISNLILTFLLYRIRIHRQYKRWCNTLRLPHNAFSVSHHI